MKLPAVGKSIGRLATSKHLSLLLCAIFASPALALDCFENNEKDLEWKHYLGDGFALRSCQLPSNGKRLVTVIVSRELQPSSAVTLNVFFHGWGGYRVYGETGIVSRVTELLEHDSQRVIVIPAGGAKTPFNSWMRGQESFGQLIQDSMQILSQLTERNRTPAIDRLIVDAHSGGGRAIRNAILDGDFYAHKINFQDAAYGSWAQVATRWALRNQAKYATRVESWYTNHATPPQNSREIKRMAPAIVEIHEVRIPHSAVAATYLGTD